MNCLFFVQCRDPIPRPKITRGAHHLTRRHSFDSAQLFGDRNQDISEPCDYTLLPRRRLDASDAASVLGLRTHSIKSLQDPIEHVGRSNKFAKNVRGAIASNSDSDGNDDDDDADDDDMDSNDTDVDADSSDEAADSDEEVDDPAVPLSTPRPRINRAENVANDWKEALPHLNNVALQCEAPFVLNCWGCGSMLGDQIRFRCLDCWKFDLCETCQNATHPAHSLCRWTYHDPTEHRGGFHPRPTTIVELQDTIRGTVNITDEPCECAQSSYRDVKIIRMGGRT